jgi:hypothetical protein
MTQLQNVPRIRTCFADDCRLRCSVEGADPEGCNSAITSHYQPEVMRSSSWVIKCPHFSHHPTIRYMVNAMATIRWCPIYPKWDSYQPLFMLNFWGLNRQLLMVPDDDIIWYPYFWWLYRQLWISIPIICGCTPKRCLSIPMLGDIFPLVLYPCLVLMFSLFQISILGCLLS